MKRDTGLNSSVEVKDTTAGELKMPPLDKRRYTSVCKQGQKLRQVGTTAENDSVVVIFVTLRVFGAPDALEGGGWGEEQQRCGTMQTDSSTGLVVEDAEGHQEATKVQNYPFM